MAYLYLGVAIVAEVIATTATGARARVPAAWFVRECPPPPPLAPGVYSA